MSVKNIKSVSSALQQDSKSLNELFKTTNISTCQTIKTLFNLCWGAAAEEIKSVSNDWKRVMT